MRISPKLTVVLLAVLVAAACAATAAKAELTLRRFAVGVSEEDGTPDVQAGSHPFALTTSFLLNGVGPLTGYLRDIKLELPPGLVGDPTATPRCGYQEFIAQSCGFETQVGVASTYLLEGQQAGAGEVRPTTDPVYNLVPPPGVAGEFGFVGAGKVPELLRTSVRSGADYGLTLSVPYVSQAALVVASKVTIWVFRPLLRTTSCAAASSRVSRSVRGSSKRPAAVWAKSVAKTKSKARSGRSGRTRSSNRPRNAK